MIDTDCSPREALTTGVDPSGVPFAELDPQLLRDRRSSIKWRRFPADVLPLFVAEMDFAVAPRVRRAITERVDASDLGYVESTDPLAASLIDFARDRWSWRIPHDHVHLATDVATAIVEALRVGRPEGGRLALATPTYPGFFEMFEEVPFEVLEVPLRREVGGGVRLDLDAIERAFAGGGDHGTDPDADDHGHGRGIDAFVLCNPHNPHGHVHSAEDLARLAQLAAEHDVFVVSDEIHAPLVHSGVTFTPFAPLAAEAGALSVTAISASKGWNLAGAKCAALVAADERSNDVLRRLPPETLTRVSILGLHANAVAFAEARDWLDRAIAQIEANCALLAELVPARLPRVTMSTPAAGYLAWLDFRDAGLGDDPYHRILHEARVAFNDGAAFGTGGRGHVRANLACAPQTLQAAVDRVASILPASTGLPA